MKIRMNIHSLLSIFFCKIAYIKYLKFFRKKIREILNKFFLEIL